MLSGKFIQKTIPVGPLQCNCQILICPISLEAVLIDPGADAPRIEKEIESLEKQLNAKIKVKALFHTHAHFDHIGATREVKEHFQNRAAREGAMENPVPQIFLHQADEEMYLFAKKQAEMFGFEGTDPLPIDQYFEDNQKLRVGSLKFTILHTPGHSPGGVCMRLHEDSAHQVPETIFTGDTLFQHSIGRSDLWGGDESTLLTSIHQRLLTLDGDTVAWPGHGPKTRIGDERISNPFLT